MSLNQFAAEKRMAIYDDLLRGLDPREGSYDADALKEARTKGSPQMGTTRYKPDRMMFEYIYPDPLTTSEVLVVSLDAPERIVYMPVPSWVVENIWQGDVEGAFHFESDALRLVSELQSELAPAANLRWFEPQAPKRRE